MAIVKVVDLVSKAQTLLQDATGTRWSGTELQGWLNDGYREIVVLRPDANTLIGEFTCAAGPRQNITTVFPSAIRVMEVIRNTATGSTKSRVRLATRKSVDGVRPTWYSDAGTVNIELFMFDPRTPREFLVFPPATTAARLEVEFVAVPTPHTLSASELASPVTAEVIRVDDSFSGVLLDYMMYRGCSKDSEVAASMARATAHYQAFQTALGAKGQTEAASQPGVA